MTVALPVDREVVPLAVERWHGPPSSEELEVLARARRALRPWGRHAWAVSPRRRRGMRLALVFGSVALVACGGGAEGPPATGGAVLVADAAFPAALAPLPDGGLLYGERLAGRVRRVGADGRLEPEPLAVLAVSTEGQRGLLGLAVDPTGRAYATWTQPEGDIVVGQVSPGPVRLVWQGPPSSRLANGGHLEFDRRGRLVVGVGDLENGARAADPAAPNGKLLALDPGGEPDQRPAVVSAGWNNPFAYDVGPDGALWVADNAPGDAPERLARGDRDGQPSAVTELEGRVAPSGLAVVPGRGLAVCGYLTRRLTLHEVDEGRARREGEVLAADCAVGVVRLADGRLAYADETTIRVLPADAVGR